VDGILSQSESLQQLADFLVYLFEIKQLVPFTIKGYRSAIGSLESDFFQGNKDLLTGLQKMCFC
jgi:ADP-glucose pyrophosphorylase